MKKIICLSVLALLYGTVMAQVYNDLDTIQGDYDCYYRYDWYENCSDFLNSEMGPMFFYSGDLDNLIMAKEQYTPQPLLLDGLSAMVEIVDTSRIHNPNMDYEHRRPEYLYLYQFSSSAPDSLILLDSVRWDTTTPKVMKLPLRIDASAPADFLYCYAYEAHFKSPVMVDSIFYIGGTFNSDSLYKNEITHQNEYHFCPVTYVGICDRYNSSCIPLYAFEKLYYRYENPPFWEMRPPRQLQRYGVFFGVTDKFNLSVESDSLPFGTVEGGGRFYSRTYDTIRAIPQPGYKFTHWNDGNSDNPRVVYLTQDTSFTAYFDELQRYTVTVEVNNADWGTASGAGTYEELQPVTLTAQPATGFYFHRWDDGDSNNPRIITLTQDTAFTAVFSDHIGVDAPERLPFTLYPNPAGTTLTIAVGTADRYRVEIFDAAGRRAATADFEGDSQQFDVSQLPAGHYLLQLSSCGSTPQRASAQPFVKQ